MWRTKELGEVATLQRGFDLPIQSRLEGSVPIYAANGPIGFHDEVRVAGPGVITGRSGSIGKVHYVESGYWPLNTSLYVKDFHGNDPRYIYWLLQNLRLDRFHHGTGVPTLNRNVVHRELVPVPPFAEQRRIAAILDKADALRTKRRQAIAKFDQLLQSVFLEMFGDPVTNPKSWPRRPLSELTSKIGSGATPKGGDSAYHSSGISLIRSLNVHDGEFRLKNLAFIDEGQAAKLRNVIVEPDDVLLNITGASVARVCRAPTSVLPARVNQHVSIIRCRQEVSPAYLERVLMSPTMKAALLQSAGSGATREAITKRQIVELLVPAPPIKVQERFVAVAGFIATQAQSSQEAFRRQEELFSSLQRSAFSDGI